MTRCVIPLRRRAGMDHADEPFRIPLSDVFDLHTVRPKDVEEAVEAYLEEANRLGLKALRIIHGRGIGVQREIVRAVLTRTSFVLSYQDAPLEAGGWGATIVTLR
ncbi:MAG: Smr/MutS family protein [Terriglobia bacterium]